MACSCMPIIKRHFYANGLLLYTKGKPVEWIQEVWKWIMFYTSMDWTGETWKQRLFVKVNPLTYCRSVQSYSWWATVLQSLAPTHLNQMQSRFSGLRESSRQACWDKLELNYAGHWSSWIRIRHFKCIGPETVWTELIGLLPLTSLSRTSPHFVGLRWLFLNGSNISPMVNNEHITGRFICFN